MAHELVGERAADAFEEDRVVRVLENAAVPLPLDVLEVILRRPARRVALAHVAESAGELRETLATARVAKPFDRKVTWLRELRTRNDRESRLVEEQRGRGSRVGGRECARKVNSD